MRLCAAATIVVATAFLGGCATSSQQPTSTQSYPANTRAAAAYGVVDSIQVVNSTSNSGGMGAGTVVGGVVGGLLCNQVGGAVAGHQIENTTERRRQRIRSAYTSITTAIKPSRRIPSPT